MDNFEDTPPIDPFSPPEDGSLVPSGATTALADPGLSLRQPPKNIEVEQGLLGALLTNNMAFERVSTFSSLNTSPSRFTGGFSPPFRP